MSTPNYKSFDPVDVAEKAINYLTQMTDKANDYLPYWLILPHKKPAEAAHCKVDDAELVASWFEGISCAREITGNEIGAKEQAYALLRAVKTALRGLYFVETMENPIEDGNNTYYTLVARFRRIIGSGESMPT